MKQNHHAISTNRNSHQSTQIFHTAIILHLALIAFTNLATAYDMWNLATISRKSQPIMEEHERSYILTGNPVHNKSRHT